MIFFILKAFLFEPFPLLRFFNSDFKPRFLVASVSLYLRENEINLTIKEAESYPLIPEETSVHITLNLTV